MNSYLTIDALALSKLITQPRVLVVDVRNEEEVARGRIPNAMHIPLSMLPVDYGKLLNAEYVVFYCHSGIRSALAADFALSKEIKSVYNLEGGVIAWMKAGYALIQK